MTENSTIGLSDLNTAKQTAENLASRLIAKPYMADILKRIPDHPEALHPSSEFFRLETVKALCDIAKIQKDHNLLYDDTFDKATRYAVQMERSDDNNDDEDDEEIPQKYGTDNKIKALCMVGEYKNKCNLDVNDIYGMLDNSLEYVQNKPEMLSEIITMSINTNNEEKTKHYIRQIVPEMKNNVDRIYYLRSLVEYSKFNYKKTKNLSLVETVESSLGLNTSYLQDLSSNMKAKLYFDIAEIAQSEGLKDDFQKAVEIAKKNLINFQLTSTDSSAYDKEKIEIYEKAIRALGDTPESENYVQKLLELFQKGGDLEYQLISIVDIAQIVNGNSKDSKIILDWLSTLQIDNRSIDGLRQLLCISKIKYLLGSESINEIKIVEKELAEDKDVLIKTIKRSDIFNKLLLHNDELDEYEEGVEIDETVEDTNLDNDIERDNQLNENLPLEMIDLYLLLSQTCIDEGKIVEGIKNLKLYDKYEDGIGKNNRLISVYSSLIQELEKQRIAPEQLKSIQETDLEKIFKTPNIRSHIEIGFESENFLTDPNNLLLSVSNQISVSLGKAEKIVVDLQSTSGEEKDLLMKQYKLLVDEALELYRKNVNSTNAKTFVEGWVLTGEYDAISNQLLGLISSEGQLSEDNSLRIVRMLKGLIEIDNPKGKDIATRIFASETLNPKLKEYLARKLFDVGYWDKKLASYINASYKGLSPNEVEIVKQEQYKTLQVLISEFGLTPDLSAYQLFENTEILSSTTLKERVVEVKQFLKEFEGKNRDELIEIFQHDKRKAKIFYVLKGGEYRYSVVNDYSFDKFEKTITKINELKVNTSVIDRFYKILTSSGVKETEAFDIVSNFRAGKPIMSDRNSFTFSSDVELGSMLDSALENMNSVWNRELKSLLIAKSLNFNPSNMDESLKKLADAESQISEILNKNKKLAQLFKTLQFDSSSKIDSRKIESIAKDVRQRMLDKYPKTNKSEQNKLQRNKMQQLNDVDIIAEYLREFLPTDNEEQLSPASTEWVAHFKDGNAFLKQAMANNSRKQNKVSSKDFELTFLDKNKDFMRAIRFADSAQCCFNSSSNNFQQRTYEFVTRLNKDPLSFILDIGLTNSQEKTGFVFGRMGVNPQSGKLVILLNGIYSQHKGNAYNDNILKLIEEKLARPMHAEKIVIGSKWGGKIQQPQGYDEDELELEAIRALSDKQGNPETRTYDDIGTIANGIFTFSEGYIKTLTYDDYQ